MKIAWLLFVLKSMVMGITVQQYETISNFTLMIVLLGMKLMN
jgi:hypothetical protein